MRISAYYLLRERHEDFARRSFTGGLLFATIASFATLISGDANARMVAEYQPAKLAAFEGHMVKGPADLLLIPGGLSLLLYGKADAEVIGLDRIRPEFRPPVALSFWSFRSMAALGVFFIVVTLYASWLRWRGKLFEKRWLLWFSFSPSSEPSPQTNWDGRRLKSDANPGSSIPTWYATLAARRPSMTRVFFNTGLRKDC